MKIFSANQVRKWDAYTIANEPVSSAGLMERAARACFTWINQNIGLQKQYIIFCGTGNNGGDGLAITRMLFETGATVEVHILGGDKKSNDFTIQLDTITQLAIPCNYIDHAEFPAVSNGAIIIDALFGTGLSRPLLGTDADLVSYLNNSSQPIISIDMPSGLFADTSSHGNMVIKADHTLSFQVNKLAFFMAGNNQFTGNIHLLDIGLHAQFYEEEPTLYSTIDEKEIGGIYKPRNQYFHKYNLGHVLLYAGSKNMMGAAILCAKACLRSGTGLVTVFTEDSTQPVIQIALPEAITTTDYDFERLSKKKSAIGVGPGLALNGANKDLLRKIIAEYPGPLVIDATGLQMLSADTGILQKRKSNQVILTPHGGEFEILFGKTTDDFEMFRLAVEKSCELGCYIILKGHNTLVTCPDGNAYFNTTGNAGMATAGSGDVLTGMLTGLVAQGYPPKNACLLGVYLHGKAGDIAAEKTSQEAMIAGDIIDCAGEAFKTLIP